MYKRRRRKEAEETCEEINKDLSRVDARESDDACRFLRNFSAKKNFSKFFPPIKTFGELGIDP